MKQVTIFLSGLLFGVGLLISGMHDPAVVLGFLDPFGQWNPALAFVMLGGVSVTLVGYRLLFARSKPVFTERFSIPNRTDIDLRLIGGAAMFGVGWGLVGLCPGPALLATASDFITVVPFFAAMMAGIFLGKKL